MKKILLLGGFGFIGSNLLDYIDSFLLNLYEVIVFDKFKHHPEGIKFNCIRKIYSGNFSDSLDIENIFKENHIDIIIHALNTTVPTTSGNICFDIESNLIPSIKLFDIMVKYKVNKIIYISSGGAIYGNNNLSNKHNEDDVVYPVSSYGIVKLSVEKYLYQYSYLYDFQSTIFRLSNPYGRYHYNNKQGIINVALRSAFYEIPFSVWGDGKAEKDYIYINDFCDILFKFVNKKEKYIVLNVGSGQIISINRLLHDIKNLIPSFTWNYVERIKTDVERFELDTTKLLSMIEPYKYTPFTKGLENTFNWLKETK